MDLGNFGLKKRLCGHWNAGCSAGRWPGELSLPWEFGILVVDGMGLGWGWDIAGFLDRFAGSTALWAKPEQQEILGFWEEF